MSEIYKKLAALSSLLGKYERIAVAFSGGVDSTLLLSVAHEVLGDNAFAITAITPFFPHADRETVSTFCGAQHIRCVLIEPAVLTVASVQSNPPDRCYWCKRTIFQNINEIADQEGASAVVDGTNADDDCADRPGMRALEELGVVSPLKMVGLTKAEIRLLAHERGLAVWDMPAHACLATRIPYGTPLDEEVLYRIDAAEASLSQLGFSQVRVRAHGEVARIELPIEESAKVVSETLVSEVIHAIKEAGFSYVALDLEGYRTGSMNEQ